MSTTVTQLLAGIKGIVQASTGYGELSLSVDVESNAKIMAAKKYSVLPGAMTEVEGVTRFYTIEQNFKISLTDSYIKLKSDDTNKRNVAVSLLDKIHDIYKELIKQKAGVPAIVMIVRSLSVDEPIYFGAEDTVLISMNFNIVYRIAI